MKNLKDGDELPISGPDFNPLEIVHSHRFTASVADTELMPAFCDMKIIALLDTVCDHAPAELASSKAYTDACDLCRNKDGMIVTNPVLTRLGEEQTRLGKPYWQALDVLTFAVEAHILNVVFDALELAGVTEAQAVKEIARCAMRGGQMWDGGGFTKPGETPQPSHYARMLAPREKAAPPNLCPHCGNEIAADAARCPFCERRIG